MVQLGLLVVPSLLQGSKQATLFVSASLFNDDDTPVLTVNGERENAKIFLLLRAASALLSLSSLILSLTVVNFNTRTFNRC